MHFMRVATAVFTALLIAGSAHADPIAPKVANDTPQFSADMITRAEMGAHVMDMQSRIFSGKDMVRVETTLKANPNQGATNGVSIVRMDKGMIWVLFPQQKTFMAMPLTPESIAKYRALRAEGAKGKFIDSLMVDGKKADRYDISKDECKGYSYFVSGTFLPMKVDLTCGEKHTVTDFRNLKEGSQPESLFELPEGYTPMQSGKVQVPSQVHK